MNDPQKFFIFNSFFQKLDLVASGAADLTVKFWNLSQGKLIKTIDQFSHWIIHLVIQDDTQNKIQRFQNKSILITMTKDNLR